MKLKDYKFFQFINIILALFSLLLIIYTYSRFELANIDNDQRNSYYKFFFIITASNLIYWVIVLILNNKSITEYSLIVFVSAYLTFFSIEVLIVKYNINSLQDVKILLRAKIKNVEFDVRDRVQLYKDFKLKNKDISLTVSGSNFINTNGIQIKDKNFFPLSGISNAETLYCNENGQYSKYLSDRHGFNNNDQIWDLNELEWVLLGDSFTHGACVNKGENLASKIEYYSKKKVLNLGYTGNGPLLTYATGKEYLNNKKIKKLIYFYYSGNDFTDLEYELKSNYLQKYFTKAFRQNIDDPKIKKNVDSEIKKFIEKKYHKESKYTLIQQIKLIKLRIKFLHQYIFKKDNLGDEIKEIDFKNEKYLRNIIEGLNDIANSNSGLMYFVYLPSYNNITLNSKQIIKEKNIINKILISNQIKFIDVHKLFLEQKNPEQFFPFGLYGHYNAQGYDYISKYVVEQIN